MDLYWLIWHYQLYGFIYILSFTRQGQKGTEPPHDLANDFKLSWKISLFLKLFISFESFFSYMP